MPPENQTAWPGRHRFIYLGIAAALAYWILEAAVHSYVMNGRGLIDSLTSREPHELWMRFCMAALVFAFGLYAHFHEKRHIEEKEQLRESEEVNRAILNTVLDGIITINDHGIILKVNPEAEKVFGYTAGEMIGNNVSMLMPEPYASHHDEYIKRYLDTRQPRVVGIGREVAGLRKDGTTFPLELGMNEVRLDGKVMFTGVVRDLTGRKKMEKQKQDFYAMVTHDIKSPLTVILAYAEIMADEAGGLDKESRGMAESIIKSSDKVLELLDDFLAISKVEAGNFRLDLKETGLGEVLEDLYGQFRPLAEKDGHAFSLELADGLPVVEVDRSYLGRAVTNLLSNAFKFTPAGGAVGLKAAIEESAGERLVRVSVSDTGAGIAPEDRPKVFEKYYRTKGATNVKGTGLGLAIVKAVAEAHKGRVELESEPGKGSRFSIVLPVKAGARAGRRADDRAARAA
ncbi:MAG: PAS domain S-box protein [Nitrospirae bacterium]|nr:PAS domain S-box protein [Nitrospirota bacterium]MBI5695317.1 PAS domain S-box protein [Nitrospirota bacterium]